MTDAWKQCEGQVIENNFPLQQYLGGTDYSAVFLTQLADPPAQKAAIKFIPASTSADLQLSVWRRTAQLTHPNLLRIFGAGRCRLANMDLLYAVMEYAEEDLSQILPQRPLSTSEAREMLEPVLDALVYLHDKGLVHAHIKPSNVLAAADRLKLSSDTLFPAGESRRPSRRSDAYDAPEVANSTLSVGADVWSLGVTLVEALTQQLPVLPLDNQANPIFPDTLPQPFLDIVRHALRRDPKRRCTIAEIAACLNPVAVAAAAAQSVSPLPAPPSLVPAVPAAKLQIPKPVPPRPILLPLPPEIASPPRQTLVLPNYVVPLAAAILVVVAIIALPKILSRRPESSSSTTSASAQPASQPKPAEKPARRETPPPKPSSQNSLKTAPAKNSAAQSQRPSAPAGSAPAAAPAPASLRADTPPSANESKAAASSPVRGEVLDQILPDVSEKARDTIHGTVRVTVRVHVDPAGNVSQAEPDAPGPSPYFADLALNAARRWQFTSPEINGHSVPSEWLIRFEFTPSDTKAFPTQTAP
jgi:TonB family protein